MLQISKKTSNMSSTNSNLALLIDADNVSYKVISGVLAEIVNYGTARVRRIYGDWTSPLMTGWKSCLLNHPITPIQQFAYTTGKNATDRAVIIDAMDLLYTGRFSSFCIVSSDSDFTRLVARIREQGVTVYGFGERKTPNSLVAACTKFTYLDVLPVNVEPQEVAPTADVVEVLKPAMASLVVKDRPAPRPIDEAARKGIHLAITNSTPYKADYVNLANVGIYLSKIGSNLNARNYGYGRLSEFLEASGMVEITYKDMGDKPPIALVRLKNNNGT